MNTGDVYFWPTRKVKGRVERDKYHIYICDDDWEDGITFLFICSANYYGDFLLTQTDCEFLEKEESFISCTSPIFYSESELKSYKPEFKGRLDELGWTV